MPERFEIYTVYKMVLYKYKYPYLPFFSILSPVPYYFFLLWPLLVRTLLRLLFSVQWVIADFAAASNKIAGSLDMPNIQPVSNPIKYHGHVQTASNFLLAAAKLSLLLWTWTEISRFCWLRWPQLYQSGQHPYFTWYSSSSDLIQTWGPSERNTDRNYVPNGRPLYITCEQYRCSI